MSVSSSTCSEWVVLLEVADDDGYSGIDRNSFARLVESWVDARPTTVYSPSRYALQVSVEAASPALALSAALWRWKDALRHSGLPEWGLVRAELVTPDELEREIFAGEIEGDGEAPALRDHPRPAEVMVDDLLRRALSDGLTGLLSREVFLDDVRRALAPGAGSAPVHGVIALHLAGFRSVDVPPVAADAVLVELAGRLAGTVRGADSVARVGHDELAVLVPGRSPREIEPVAARILDRVGAPVAGLGGSVVITASLGMAMTSPGDDADIVMLNAERAMQAASDAGGGYSFLQPSRRRSPDDVG